MNKLKFVPTFTKLALACSIIFASLPLFSTSVDARESSFVREGSGPLYWSTYEHQYTRNAPIDETTWKNNVDWIAREYKDHGYDMVVTDGWIEPAQRTNENGYIISHNDEWEHDWTYWAQYVQDKGLKLGVYYNPLWVTRSAASDPTKTVVGTNYKVKDIANSSDTFNDELYWVDVTKPGAKEYIQGYIKYFKDMGVPYLRIDFLSWYESGTDKGRVIGVNHGEEKYKTALKWMHEAAGSDMELSLVMPHLNDHAANELPYGDMIRINEDLAHGGWENLSIQRQNWVDNWSQWANPFVGFTGFSDVAGRGSIILDGDFIRMNTFANDHERETIINLFTMAGSPIAITDQVSTIGNHGRFYKNKNMLDLNKQGFVGKPYYNNAKPYSVDPTSRDTERWLGQLPDGSWVVGLFNRSNTKAIRSINYVKDLGLSGSAVTQDLWTNEKLGAITQYNPTLPAHASKVVSVKTNGANPRYQAEVATWMGGANFNNNHKGYNGFGFVDKLAKPGAKVLIAVEAPSDGTYNMTFRYGNATGASSTMKVSTMDESGNTIQAAKTVSFANKANWSEWANKTDSIKLQKGVNLISIERTGSDRGAINLDYIELNTRTSEPYIVNGGFETGDLTGWTEWHPRGQLPRYGVDSYNEYSGDSKLYFWGITAYQQSAHQLVSGLEDGSYTVSTWVKLTLYGKTPKTVRMEVAQYGGNKLFKNISPSTKYQKISATVNVTNGQLDIGFYVDSLGYTSLQIDKVEIVKN